MALIETTELRWWVAEVAAECAGEMAVAGKTGLHGDRGNVQA